MESDSIKRQIWFNEPIVNNHIILRYSFLLFKKRELLFNDANVWTRFKSNSIKKQKLKNLATNS